MTTTKRRRCVVSIVLFAAVMTVALPAHARFGYTHVDTWARYRHRIVDRNGIPGPLGVWAPPRSTRRVIWSVENQGTAYPKIHSVTFNGCDDGNGFRFHYFTPSDKDVSWRVTHDGFDAAAEPHHKAWLNVRIRSTGSDRSYTCVLSGLGNGPARTADTVNVALHS
jgi:hypothetical protein